MKSSVIIKPLIWLQNRIPHKQFVLVLSFIVGLISGLLALLLKNTVHYTHHFFFFFFDQQQKFFYFILPMAGILITLLIVKLVVRDNIGHGISKILHSISRKNSVIKGHNMFSSIITSTFTIGMGGSVGGEAPIVLTGAAIGSNLGRSLRLDYKTITLLLGCGAAGAIAGIFKAPITGLLFTFEVLMLNLSFGMLIPLLISAITAASIAYLFMGEEVLLSYNLQAGFELLDFPALIILGLVCGFVSLYFTRGVMFIESLSSKIKGSYNRFLVFASVLCLLIFIFPPLFGEGYTTLKSLLNGNVNEIGVGSFFMNPDSSVLIIILFLTGLLVFKVVATAATTSAGGVGGIFAPTLFMGGVTGFLFAILINTTTPFEVSPSLFALVGMGGLMAGVMHAPLTGIFLIAELTGGYDLLLPLMAVATVSYITIMFFEPHSIYTKRLAQRGELLTHDKDKNVLTLLQLESVIETDFLAVQHDNTLGQLIKKISKSKRNLFPVVSEENVLMGVVLLNDIRHIMFTKEAYQITFVENLMIKPPAWIFDDESMDSVMEKFQKTSSWNLPVITREGQYVGFISKAKIFNEYRKILKNHTVD